jgi:hypothetical protein
MPACTLGRLLLHACLYVGEAAAACLLVRWGGCCCCMPARTLGRLLLHACSAEHWLVGSFKTDRQHQLAVTNT